MTNYCIEWNSHYKGLTTGLSDLQHNEEFVDMTIAADGYLTKVHRNIIALASPYLRAILKTVPCSHPVIFMDDIEHDVLCLIFEYIYTGEVLIPKEKFKKFMDVGKRMQINGLTDCSSIPGGFGNYSSPTDNETTEQEHSNAPYTQEIPHKMVLPEVKLSNTSQVETQGFVTPNIESLLDMSKTGIDDPITDSYLQFPGMDMQDTNSIGNFINFKTTESPGLLSSAFNNNINDNSQIKTDFENLLPVVPIQTMDFSGFIENAVKFPPKTMESGQCKVKSTPLQIKVSFDDEGKSVLNLVEDIASTAKATEATVPCTQIPAGQKTSEWQVTPKYTLSIRGNIQMILNRYMYNSIYGSKNKVKRRWRCIDYRNGCQAFIDTEKDVIVSRKNLHKHARHDRLIHEKASKNLFFTNLELAIQASKEEEKIQLRAKNNLQQLKEKLDKNKKKN